MRKQIIFCSIFILLFNSCTWLLGVQKLGNRIYFDYPTIIMTETKEYKGVGDYIIPPKILDIEKDKKFVIVRTLNGKNIVKYWLIDKTIESKRLGDTKEDSCYWSYTKYSNVFGPLDSIEFFNLKQQKGVELDW